MIYIFFLIASFKSQLSQDLWRGNMDLLFASFFLATTRQLQRNKKAALAEGKDLEGNTCHCAHSRRMGQVMLMCCEGRNDAWSPGLSSQLLGLLSWYTQGKPYLCSFCPRELGSIGMIKIPPSHICGICTEGQGALL